MKKPTVLSFCAIFLRKEMQHIYRQVTGLQRYETVAVTEERSCETVYPFPRVAVLPRPRIAFLQRIWRKFALRQPSLLYRGYYDALRSAIDPLDADLMHIYFGHTGVHLLPFIQRWDRPAVVSFHGMDAMPRAHDKTYAPRMRVLLETVPLVFARSQSLARVLVERGCPPEKIRINRTSIPLKDFSYRRRQPVENGELRIVQACRLIEKKGIDLTLHAFAEMVKKFPAARLSLIGEGPQEASLRELAQELQLSESVDFSGFLPPEKLAEKLHEAHLFVHPSRVTAKQDQEGIPNSLLEAMATGLPVVATLHGGIPEAVEHGKTGLLCPENDAPALSRSLLELAENFPLRDAMGAAASDAVAREFSPESQIQKLESYYDEARELFRRSYL